ncbi:MAG: hypothetical protein HY710_04305 [Candidatus Latescibacteria bacterium]|nr:hypothetical protein [Candidatus Latescibacterota bacterium]
MARQMITPRLPRRCFALLSVLVPILFWTRTLRAEEEPPQVQRLARGKQSYDMLCAGCHGTDGESTSRGENTKTLPGIGIRRTDYEIGHRLRGLMAALFTEEERADLVAYVKSFKGPKGYARPELVINATALTPFITDPGVRIVDLRPADAYAQSHLPNAVHLDEDALRTLPDAARFAALMEGIGVGNNTCVVAYDDNGGRGAARLWAALTYYGHPRVSILDGGWRKWLGDGRDTTVWRPSQRVVTFTPWPQPDVHVTAAELRACLKAQDVVLLDASPSFMRQNGWKHRVIHLESTNTLQPDGTFRPAAELLSLYAAVGITPDRRVVTMGTDWAQAAMAMFTLRLLGYPDVRMYDGTGTERAGEIVSHTGQ